MLTISHLECLKLTAVFRKIQDYVSVVWVYKAADNLLYAGPQKLRQRQVLQCVTFFPHAAWDNVAWGGGGGAGSVTHLYYSAVQTLFYAINVRFPKGR